MIGQLFWVVWGGKMPRPHLSLCICFRPNKVDDDSDMIILFTCMTCDNIIAQNYHLSGHDSLARNASIR